MNEENKLQRNERDAMRQIMYWHNKWDKLFEDYEKLRIQRDRLREILKRIGNREFLSDQAISPTYVDSLNDRMDQMVDCAKKALAETSDK